jgi:hypothetical protein
VNEMGLTALGRSRGSPLNARPFGAARDSLGRHAWRKLSLLLLIGLALIPTPAPAESAVTLLTFIPCVGVCPSPGYISGLTSGEVFPLFVAAVDAAGNRDPSYTGTIVFSSSDPLATLPPNYTFTAADQGSHTFLNAGVLRTPGSQTISAADASNALPAGVWAVTVSLPAQALAIPATTRAGVILTALLLAAAASWILYSRS